MALGRRKRIVPESYVGLMYEKGAFKRLLEPGGYVVKRHWFDRVARAIVTVDVRERSLTIKGQEILTRDKVAIRVSLLVYFRIRADVKDLIFPGNLREIMNQVLETERRAEARLIAARKDAD